MGSRLQLINHWLNITHNLYKGFLLKTAFGSSLSSDHMRYITSICARFFYPKIKQIAFLFLFAGCINFLVIYNQHYHMANFLCLHQIGNIITQLQMNDRALITTIPEQKDSLSARENNFVVLGSVWKRAFPAGNLIETASKPIPASRKNFFSKIFWLWSSW